jgi:hypothetical protein
MTRRNRRPSFRLADCKEGVVYQAPNFNEALSKALKEKRLVYCERAIARNLILENFALKQWIESLQKTIAALAKEKENDE